ncbi:MAG: ParA family protein [Lachnospiraceae bacterium]|nr:ParA family protein [Lachnospiraceae bacterium]
MAKIISVINEKGGIGKTSTCFNVAWELSNQKKKVLLIDMDAQRANLSFFANVDKTDDLKTLRELMAGADPKEIIKNVKKNLDIVPASMNIGDLNAKTAKISSLRKALDGLRDEYDYMFIDVNPDPTWAHVLSLSVADYAIIPMLPDVASLEANIGVEETIQEVRETTNPSLKVMGLLFNKNSYRTNLAKDVISVAESMAKRLDSKVFQTRIRQAVSLSENVAAHMGITDYDKNSAAADDIRSLVKEIKKEK